MNHNITCTELSFDVSCQTWTPLSVCHTRDTLTVERGCLGGGRNEELYRAVVDRHVQLFKKMLLLFGVSLHGRTQVHMRMCRGLRKILSVFLFCVCV